MSIATGVRRRDRKQQQHPNPRERWLWSWCAGRIARTPIFREIVGLGMQTEVNDLRTSGCQRKGEYMRRICDVLQPLLSEVDELGRNRSPHMPPCIGGDADSPGRGEAFQTRR